MIVWKAIKAKGFRAAAFREEFEKTFKEIAPQIKKQYQKTTETWEHEKPTFKSDTSIMGAGPTLVVYPDGNKKGVEKWMWADEGTRRHKIRPRRKKKLSFRVGGAPKTRPNVVASFPGRGGDQWRSAKEVIHPGTKPRNWSKMLVKEWTPKFRRRIEEAIDIAIRKSGLGA